MFTTHDWEWFIYTTYKNGDDRARDGLWHCLPTLWDIMGILLDVSKLERPHCFCLTGVMGIV